MFRLAAVFIVREEQVFEYSHWEEHTGHFVNKIKVVYSRKEKQELAKQGAYKLSFWQRLKFFGLGMKPKERAYYDIIPLDNGGYKIRERQVIN